MRTASACLPWPGENAFSSCHSLLEESTAPTLPGTASTGAPTLSPTGDSVTIPLPPPSRSCFPRTCPRIPPALAKPSLASAQPNPTWASSSMEQKNLMTPQTEDSISLIPCCFQILHWCPAPGTEPGSVPWQSPAHPCLQQPLPTAHLSPGQPWVSPGLRAPSPAPRDAAAEGSVRHHGCSAEEHPPSSFLLEGKFPASHHQSASSIMFPLITFSFTSLVKSVYNQRQESTAQGGV